VNLDVFFRDCRFLLFINLLWLTDVNILYVIRGWMVQFDSKQTCESKRLLTKCYHLRNHYKTSGNNFMDDNQ